MSAIANSAAPTSARKPARRLLVRMNSTLFHCIGAAVLLEQTGAVCAGRIPGGQSNDMWTAERQKLSQWLRAYAGSVWPEFGWDAACAAMAAVSRQPAASANDVVASDHRALFYRALGAIAEDGELCRVLRQIASIEESRRDALGTDVRPGSVGALRGFHSTRGYVEHARNRVVRAAFDLLQQHWSDAAPFPASDYDAFLLRAYAVLASHMQLDWTRRLLYRGWLTLRAPSSTRRAPAPLHVRTRDIGGRMQELAARPACALPSASVVR